jgi:hypothetical protein
VSNVGHPRFKRISLVFERREDDGLRVYSDDVPGFVLSHEDAAKVFADLKPALETILGEMLGGAVVVGPLEDLREQLEDGGLIPTGRQTYVAQLEDA